MPRYILTGTPGAGKTAILRLLERAGYAVVEEAATDVIALEQALGRPRPEQWPGFLAAITALQRQRQERLAPPGGVTVVFDRSPVCTLALARFLALPVPATLTAELDRMTSGHVYEREVFFVRNQGSVVPTAARRISFEDSLAFEQVHEQAYCERGFRLIEVAPGPLSERAGLIGRVLAELRYQARRQA
jgi:predicted ATPase